VAILLMAFGGYSINDFWWLFYLMAFGGYSTIGS
jgi:hypothetical protein